MATNGRRSGQRSQTIFNKSIVKGDFKGHPIFQMIA
jgi:hypothetical protein